MIRRYLERIKTRSEAVEVGADEIDHVVENEGPFTGLERAKPYREYVMDEAIQQYKDYFESDEEDLEDFQYINPEQRAKFAQVYKDYSRPLGEHKVVHTVPKRPYDPSKGLWTNFTEHLADVRQRIMPEIAQVAKETAAQRYGVYCEGKDFKLAEGTQEFEVIENLEEVFADTLEALHEKNEPPKIN